MNWLIHNGPWIFSGAGLVIIGWIIKLFKRRSTLGKTVQRQKSGKDSTNIQIGGDVKLSNTEDKK